MRKVIIGCVAALLAGTSAGSAHAATWKRCGDIFNDGAFVGKLGARGMSCREARWVTRNFGRPRRVPCTPYNRPPRLCIYTYRGNDRVMRVRYRRVGYEASWIYLRSPNRKRRIRFYSAA
jgi:hypothetical protein